MNVLTYGDNPILALELLTAARLHGEKVLSVSMNNQPQAEALRDHGANVYRVVTDNNLDDVNVVAEILKQAASTLECDIIIISSDRKGKELAGRLAQKLDAGCLTDVKDISIENDAIGYERNACGGATVTTQTIGSVKKVVAISPRAFKPPQSNTNGTIADFPVDTIGSRLKVREVLGKTADKVDISDAKTLIVVGCGVQKSDYLPLIESLADKFGALIGCSKPVATDWKWLPEDRVIGLSGNVCSPDTALVLGVSGQVQFTVGLRAAGTIISVNIDENAPIHGMADYYLVGDLSHVIPEMKEASD